ncbi:MAG: HPr family phosphocarrier protein [Oscillospiraceae bacterium]|nr:HPr family phosphocarrier protein [Oscillospiraceae bacterium]
MLSKKITINTIDNVKTFVNAALKCNFDIDLVSGRHAIDAKSIMGVFSLDLSKPVTVQVYTENADVFFSEIESFVSQ